MDREAIEKNLTELREKFKKTTDLNLRQVIVRQGKALKRALEQMDLKEKMDIFRR